jgi:hypothetical protein
MGLLQRLIAGKRVVPPVPPSRVVITGTIEPADPLKRADHSSGTSCFIEYTNASGEDSARTITLRRIDGHFGKPETIGAHCHVQDKYKAFRIDRIRSMVDCVTGEELDPVEHCIALHRRGALKIEDKALARVMRITTFMARCDGDFHALEGEALDDILGRYFRFFGGDDAAYECARREAMRLAPDADDVIRSIGWIKRAPLGKELAGFVLKASAAVIDADGHHREEEVYWAIELGNELKKIATREQ